MIIISKKYNIEIIRELFKEKHFVLVSKEYKNCKQKLQFICEKHNDIGIQEVTFDKFLHRNQGCSKCGYERVAKFQTKHTIKEVKDLFNNRGYDLISTEYKRSKDKLKYICRKHKEKGIQEISLNNFLQNKGCYYCGREVVDNAKRTGLNGELNPMLKGGVTQLHNYLRYKISQWKKDSFENANYKCDITGVKDNTLIIHHLYNFSDIMKETLDILNLQIHDSINKYSDSELDNITNKCIELHYKYGLGVCLCEKEHKLFHSIYGKENNTKEQYEQFKLNRLEELEQAC